MEKLSLSKFEKCLTEQEVAAVSNHFSIEGAMNAKTEMMIIFNKLLPTTPSAWNLRGIVLSHEILNSIGNK